MVSVLKHFFAPKLQYLSWSLLFYLANLFMPLIKSTKFLLDLAQENKDLQIEYDELDSEFRLFDNHLFSAREKSPLVPRSVERNQLRKQIIDMWVKDYKIVNFDTNSFLTFTEDTEMFQYLYSLGAGLETRDSKGVFTPLMIAVKRNNIEHTRFLIQQGADIEAVTPIDNSIDKQHSVLSCVFINEGSAKDEGKRLYLFCYLVVQGIQLDKKLYSGPWYLPDGETPFQRDRLSYETSLIKFMGLVYKKKIYEKTNNEVIQDGQSAQDLCKVFLEKLEKEIEIASCKGEGMSSTDISQVKEFVDNNNTIIPGISDFYL